MARSLSPGMLQMTLKNFDVFTGCFLMSLAEHPDSANNCSIPACLSSFVFGETCKRRASVSWSTVRKLMLWPQRLTQRNAGKQERVIVRSLNNFGMFL